jgi:hypothetical protein
MAFKEEFTLEGYQQHRKHQKAAAPLTHREKELNEVRSAEVLFNQMLLYYFLMRFYY